MRKVIITEVVSLIVLLVLAFAISGWIISNQAFDISAHDTYNPDGGRVWPLASFVFTFFILEGFVTYLVRTIFRRFKSIKLCIFLFVFTCLLLGYIEQSEFSLYSFLSNAYWEYSAPANTTTVKGLFYGGDGSVFRENQYLFWIKVFLILTLSFTSFMMGRYYKLKRQ